MVFHGITKCIVITVNVIFLLFGLGVLAVGIILQTGWKHVRDAFHVKDADLDFDLQKVGDIVAVAIIAIGVFIVVLSFLGCCGACCNFKVLLGLYGTIVLLLLLGQLGVVIYGVSKGNNAVDDLKKGLTDSLKNYDEKSIDDRSKAWSAIFNLGECCAITNYTDDFQRYPFIPDKSDRQKAGITGDSIPITCCRGVDYEDALTVSIFRNNSQCLNTPSSKNAYTEGCYTRVKDWIKNSKNVLIGAGVTILGFELLLVVMAFYLSCRRDTNSYTVF